MKAAGCLLLLLCVRLNVSGTTFNVNTTADGTSYSGVVNLRGAILRADALGGANTIIVPAGTYNITLGEITFGNIPQSITISGAGPYTTIVNMTTTNQDRIFNINPNVVNNIVTNVSGITFQNGHLTTDGYGGGAIVAGGLSGNALTVSNCNFTNNTIDASLQTSSIAGGGAIALLDGGALSINNCLFSGNTVPLNTTSSQSARSGGAVYVELDAPGTISVTNSAFNSNNVPYAGAGGAIFFKETSGTPSVSVSVTGNSFAANSVGSSGLGGAIYVANAQAITYNINYNRFYDNAAGSGTGLYMADQTGSIDATNNWWGCNSGPSACADKAVRGSGTAAGTLTSAPYLQLKTTAAAASVCPGNSTGITATFTSNSASPPQTISPAYLVALVALPVSFSVTNGSLSNTQSNIQSSATATGTFTGNNTGAGAVSGTVNAVVDNVPSTDLTARATITVNPGTAISTQPTSQNTCAGSSFSLSVAATGTGTLTYQWFRGTTAISGATASTYTVNSATAADAGTNYNVIVTGTCGFVMSSSVSVTLNTPGTWLGGSSAAWSNTANWACNTLPTSTTDVTIPNGTTYSPQVDITTATAQNLTISSGASLSFAGTSNVLTVAGNITNSGTFDPSAGTVVVNGTGAQAVPGGSYKNLQISGGLSAKTLSGAATVSGILSVSNCYVYPNSYNITIGSSGNISGGGASSFIVINGSGRLVQNNIGTGGRTGAVVFPVGTGAGDYTPVTLTNTGIADNFTVGLLGSAYASYDANGNGVGNPISGYTVNKTWLISEATTGGSVATATFQWNGSDEPGTFNRSACFAAHYYNGGWHDGATSAAAGSNPYSQTLSGITSFSPFGVGSAGSPLPLNLLSFTGSTQGNTNALQWTTANEVNATSFDVERSGDGSSFHAIATLTAKGISASQNKIQYSYNDADAPAAASDYRLKMTDASGAFTYSNTITLRNAGGSFSITAGPNPFRDQLVIHTQGITGSAPVAISITDVNSRTVLQRAWTPDPGNTAITLAGLGGLAPGVYFLRISFSGNIIIRKVVKTEL